MAVKDVLNETSGELDKVCVIMMKLRTPIAAEKRNLTSLKAKIRNSTRWSSEFLMVKRYREI